MTETTSNDDHAAETRAPGRSRADRQELALAALTGVKGLGPAKQRALLERFGSLEAIADADVEAIMSVPGIGEQMARDAVLSVREAMNGSPTARPSLTSEAFQERFERMVNNIGQVIRGKDETIRAALTCMLAGGHVLFEDVPGTGKTMLARSIAQTIDASTSRIQCTPDLLPADITGSPVLKRETGEFEFRPGPVFANVFLADEINRATPKTQSAMLEAMAERTVTVDRTTHPLPEPFFVLATQNPVELAGTFPLPEAQLDRFLFKLSIGYADREAEAEVLRINARRDAIEALDAVITTADVVEMMEWASGVTVPDAVTYYIIDLVEATRQDPALQLGASSRASLALMRASKVVAAAQGREDVLPDDVKQLAPAVLNHRMILTPDALLQDESVDDVIDRILHRVKIPLGVGSSG